MLVIVTKGDLLQILRSAPLAARNTDGRLAAGARETLSQGYQEEGGRGLARDGARHRSRQDRKWPFERFRPFAHQLKHTPEVLSNATKSVAATHCPSGTRRAEPAVAASDRASPASRLCRRTPGCRLCCGQTNPTLCWALAMARGAVDENYASPAPTRAKGRSGGKTPLKSPGPRGGGARGVLRCVEDLQHSSETLSRCFLQSFDWWRAPRGYWPHL